MKKIKNPRYQILNEGDEIKKGDEVLRSYAFLGHEIWKPTIEVGEKVGLAQIYRRPIWTDNFDEAVKDCEKHVIVAHNTNDVWYDIHVPSCNSSALYLNVPYPEFDEPEEEVSIKKSELKALRERIEELEGKK